MPLLIFKADERNFWDQNYLLLSNEMHKKKKTSHNITVKPIYSSFHLESKQILEKII